MTRKAKMPRRLLIANRGEIALRVLRTAQDLGIDTVAVYSDADRNALHVRRAGRAVRIGPPEPAESYLCIEKLIEAARGADCDAIHPGYGFLAENAEFARACEAAQITFVGPPASAIAAMGDKLEARRLASEAGVLPVPGLDTADPADLSGRAREIGFPVMLKAAAGGGGKGIRIIEREDELAAAAKQARAEAEGAFGDGRIYLEKLLARPRHVEVQVMGDRHGKVVHYGERECSVQRRHQKLLEESPSPALDKDLREEMCRSACKLASAVGYVGAGTVEFLLSEGHFYFLEMNTRLQVEHAVTEMRFGTDLVREQIRVAVGARASEVPPPRGHAIEVRVNAEDPETFLPSLGTISRLNMPGGPGLRADSALFRGLEVTPFYDNLLAKLVVQGADRAQAIARAERACRELRIVGVQTSVPAALRVLQSAEFRSGDYDTGILSRVPRQPSEDLLEIASLAAAVSRYRRTEGADRPSRNAAAPGLSGWRLLGRWEALGGRGPR